MARNYSNTDKNRFQEIILTLDECWPPFTFIPRISFQWIIMGIHLKINKNINETDSRGFGLSEKKIGEKRVLMRRVIIIKHCRK